MENNTLPPGSLLQAGRYKITRFISSGGFGCTYEARHVLLDKRVAIKEFFVKDFCNRDVDTSNVSVGTQSKVALIEKLKKKFIDEAKALSELKHPGIVGVSDVFIDNNTAYFVMNFIDGRSLEDMVRAEGPLDEKRALGYIMGVCDALRYVHRNNRLHLDIKPGNIMVDRATDRAILIDFGASKQYDEEGGSNTSTLLGSTPGYAPMEQMGNDVSKFTPSTDIYALGGTLYKLITGRTPISATLRASGEMLEPLPAGTSAGIVSAIEASLQINKNRRPQSIEEFVAILTAAPAATPSAATPSAAAPKGAPAAKVSTPPAAPEKTPAAPADSNPTVPVNAPAKPAAAAPPTPPTGPKSGPATVVINDAGTKEDKPTAAPSSSHAKPVKKKKSGPKPMMLILLVIGIMGIITIAIVAGIIVVGNITEDDYPATTVDTYDVDTPVAIVEAPDTLTFTNEEGETFAYVGPTTDGYPSGEGTGIYEVGTYHGMYRGTLRHGHGTFEAFDGENYFEGEFENDSYKEGTLKLNDGHYYKGTFLHGQPYTGTWYSPSNEVVYTVKEGVTEEV